MKISTDKHGEFVLEEVFNGVTLLSADGEELSICMRDTGFEFEYRGVWYEAKQGKLAPMRGQAQLVKIGESVETNEDGSEYPVVDYKVVMPETKDMTPQRLLDEERRAFHVWRRADEARCVRLNADFAASQKEPVPNEPVPFCNGEFSKVSGRCVRCGRARRANLGRCTGDAIPSVPTSEPNLSEKVVANIKASHGTPPKETQHELFEPNDPLLPGESE